MILSKKIIVIIVIIAGIVLLASVYTLTSCGHGSAGREGKHAKDHPVDATKIQKANEYADEQLLLMEEEDQNDSDPTKDNNIDDSVADTHDSDC